MKRIVDMVAMAVMLGLTFYALPFWVALALWLGAGGLAGIAMNWLIYLIGAYMDTPKWKLWLIPWYVAYLNERAIWAETHGARISRRQS